MIELEIKAAIKHLHNNHSYLGYRDFILKDCKSDALAVSYGPLTLHIATYLGVNVDKARKALNALEKKGVTIKDCTKGGSCRWWYHGLLEELRAEDKVCKND